MKDNNTSISGFYPNANTSKIWKAKWIMDEQFHGLVPINVFHKEQKQEATNNHREDLKNRHMLVRKQFTVSTDIENAFIDITADDYYKLYINGKFVGQGPAPGYYFHYNYNTFDISDFIQKGENVIAVHVYYQGLINRVWNSGDYRQGLISEVFINDDLSLYTDSSWKYTISKEYTGMETTGYDTQYLENIDERLAENGWRELNFKDTHWKNAVVNICDDHKLVQQITPSVQVYEVKPLKVEKNDNGHYIIDFGRELTGQFKMEAKGESGQVVEIRCGEEMEEGKGQSVRYNMRSNCTYRELWTLSGKNDTLEHFDYKAFRYVEVIAPEGIVRPESFLAVVKHYPFDENKCTFNSSNEMLNSVWNICKNGVVIGSQEVFVDCPGREKGQYLGDATVTAKSHLYLSGDCRLYKKALLDFALSTFICPGIMAVAPGGLMQEIADFSLQWPMQLLTYYKHTGDLSFLEEMHPIAEGCMRYFDKYKREDGLIENVREKWNLVDWPDNLRDDYDFALTQPIVGDGCHNVINAFYCGAVKTMNEIRDILGITYQDSFSSLQEAFNKAFYNKETKLFNDSTISTHSALQSNIIPLFYDMVPEEALNNVVELVRRKRLNCGVYMSYFLLKGLARAGEYGLIYELLLSEDERSWVNMIREGATTCFEAWGKDQKWNTSLCHPWASAPISVLIEDIIGLTPTVPGWKEIQFSPRIPETLNSLDFEVNVPAGKIKVACKQGKVNISVPDEIKVQYVKK